MKTVPLGEIVTFKGGGTPDKSVSGYWGGDVPWASVKDFKSTSISRTTDYITQEGVKNSATNIIPAGTIIVPTRMAVGKAAICTIDVAINQDLKALLPSKHVETRYLLHALLASSGELERHATGATVKGITLDVLRKLQIPLPSLLEQRRIAAILDQADGLRRLRRDSLARLGDLGQAIFYEMFGDPATNPKGFARMRLGDTALVFSDGPFGSNLKSSHYVEQGVRVIRLQNIGVGELIDKDKAFVSPAHFAKLRKHRCLPGDVLVGTLGDPNLRACIQPIWLEEALNKADCVQIRTNPKVATNSFICALLNVPSVEMMAHSIVQGQTRARISMGRLRELVVPVPPIREQERFSDLMNTLADQKKDVVTAIEHADALFASLQHRAFRGEL
ncbi:MAG: restriction endonuclease subunit S [Hyphomonas sp.]|nr:restriction endonuclease subunit S [Hyphomonas sp.]